MPERFRAFHLYDIEQARQKPPARLPLTFTQQELVGLAEEYKKVTGEKIPQQVLANETDVTRGAVNIQVRSILEKGYNPSIVTDLVPWPARKNERRLKALRMKVQLIHRVKELSLQGLTLPQIHRRIGKRAISENSLGNILEQLRKKKEIPKRRKVRTPEETAALKEDIKILDKLGVSNREIARKLRVSYHVVTNFKTAMYASGEMEKRKKEKKQKPVKPKREVKIQKEVHAPKPPKPKELSDKDKQIIELKKEKKLTRKQIGIRVGLSEYGVEYRLKKLRKLGSLEPESDITSRLLDQDIITLRAKGYMNKQIAEMLGQTESCIENRVRKLIKRNLVQPRRSPQ